MSVRSVWWPTEAMTGTGRSATVRQSVSSLKARRSVGSRPPRDHDRLDRSGRREVLQRSRDGGSRAAVLDRGVGPDQPAGPAAAAKCREHVVARLARLAGDHADRPGQADAREALLWLEQPLGIELLAQAVDLGEEVALSGHPKVSDVEAEGRRGGLGAGVVVAAAGDDDRRTVDERSGREAERVVAVAPHGALEGAVAVAELEVDAHLSRLDIGDLAKDLDLREGVELGLQVPVHAAPRRFFIRA